MEMSVALHPAGNKLVKKMLEKTSLERGDRLLEIGCGSGSSLALLCSEGFNAQGIDKADSFDTQNEAGFQAKFTIMDAHELNFPSNFFAGVLLECSLSTMENPQKVLREVERVLAEQGYLLLADIYQISRDKTCRYSLDWWQDLLEQAGFVLREQVDVQEDWNEYIKKVIWHGIDFRKICSAWRQTDFFEKIKINCTSYFYGIWQKKK